MGKELKADGVTGPSQAAMSRQQEQETRSAVERIAAFAVAARPERLTPEIRRLFKRTTGLTPGAYRRRFQVPAFARGA